MRAGAQTLTLLATPIGHATLQALADGNCSLLELRRKTGTPAQSTLRSHLQDLGNRGIIVRRRQNGFPGALEYSLSQPGRNLEKVSAGLREWLSLAPSGPLELGGSHAKVAVKGLVDGWSARMLAPLAIEPLSLTELDRRLPGASYPAIERRLETMQLAEQIEPLERAAGGTPYRMRNWLRRGAAPLLLAAQWERRQKADDVEALGLRELESISKLLAPLLKMPRGSTGMCRLALKESNGENEVVADLEIAGGSAAIVNPPADTAPIAHVSASTDAWLAALIDADCSNLELEGEEELPIRLFTQLRRTLFADHPDQYFDQN